MKRAEAAVSILGIVHHLWNRRLDTKIAAVSVHAGVIGKALGMAPKAELIVRLIEVTGAHQSSAWLFRSNPVRGTTLKTP